MFDYEKGTRAFYKSDQVAGEYHEAFTQRSGFNGARFRYIANQEKKAVRALLAGLPVKRVIDMPAGTGKMAAVFKEKGCQVLGCDVSENMLSVGRETYRAAALNDASFQVLDLESATEELEERFDAVVCVRLMQRVPDDVKSRMLAQMARLAPYAIVSFGVDSAYQRARHWIRRSLFNDPDVGFETRPTRGRIKGLVEHHFEIVRDLPVAAGISAQRMYLLKSKETPES